MATRTSQRVGIWVIAIVMTIGTLGAFFLPMISNTNTSTTDAAEQQKLLEEYQKQMAATSQPLDGYAAEPFDRDAVTDLKVEQLKAGDGTGATTDSKLTVNYFGWTSDGKIFDSSKKDGKTTPVDFGLSSVIPGWTEGLTGATAGSVYKLLIPAHKAYGEAGSPPTIGPNEPLAFIVEVLKVN